MSTTTTTSPVRQSATAPRRGTSRTVDHAAALQRRYRLRSFGRNLRADLLTVIAWVSVAMSITLWLADGGLGKVTSLGKGLTALGIVSGLVATDLMVLMLLLAARIPFVDRAFGHDHAVAIHTKLGKYVIYGLLLHGWFLLCGYAANDGLTLSGELGSLLSVGDLVLSVCALGILIAVGVSSIITVKRSLPYEVWHVIHLATYVAVGFSLPHQFSMSGLMGPGTFARGYWIGLFAVTGFLLLAYRVFLPVFASFEHGLVVTKVRYEANDVVSIEMQGRNLPALDVEGGQFFHWRFLAKGLWWQQHPFSVSAAPTGDTLRITIRALGGGTRKLMTVKPGTRVMIEGPYGIFSDKSRTQAGLTLIGIGIGIAPIRAILEATQTVPGRTTVILRGHTPSQLYLLREIQVLCQDKGARLITLVGSRSQNRLGETSWLPASHRGNRLVDLVPYVASSDVYVCGPQAASDLVVADALACGTPADSIHNERFVW
ncbi:MAG: ferric reductase-like transmembrane domain-containing protein [Actinobacteria bacterium]|nr:ferric reductase-like transmembrane domain-containing protein [Actinomycetota bacterium]